MVTQSAENGDSVGGILTFGPGLSFIEGASMAPDGRASPQDIGLWDDSQIVPLRELVEYAHSQNQKIGIQFNHSGRKGSTVPIWLARHAIATEAAGGWPNRLSAPSALAYGPGDPVPTELDEEGIQRIKNAWADAAARAVKAGFDTIAIHGAHGYLLHEFMSPVTNKRTDKYGGSFENRIRFAVEVVDAVRAVIPEDMPLFFRVSATDWLEEVAPDEPSWRCEDAIRLAEVLADHGVDVYDVSSGGLDPRQKITFAEPAYQARFAVAVKEKVGDKIFVASVGGIKHASVAQDVLERGVDLVLVGRQFLRDYQTVWTFAEQLGVEIKLPSQIAWVFPRTGK